MAIGDDFAIDGAGAITHVSGSTNYTVLELHRWLQDLADDAQASVGDLIDITTSTPSERATDNIITLNAPFNIDDTAAQFLYDGSITQDSGDTIYAGLVCVGAVETGTEIQVTQDETVLTSHWSTGKNPDATASILNRVIIKIRQNGADIDARKIIVWARELGDTYAEFNVTMTTGNNVAAIFTSPDLNNTTAAATIATWSDITNTEGYQLLDIAGDGSADEPYYSQWDNGAGHSSKDVYERTKWIQRRGTSETIHGKNGALFRGITHQFDYDGQSSNFATNNIVSWGTSFAYDGGTGTVPAVGQYWENLTTGGVGKVVYVSPAAGATGTVVMQREAATPTWVDPGNLSLLGGTGSIDINGAVTAPVSSSTGGSGIVLADADAGATGTLWLQLVSGSIAGNNDPIWVRGGTAGSYALVNLTATARTVSPEFFGAHTGSSVIGAFGIGITPADGVAADLFTTLTGGNVNPPNNQVFTVFGLISGEDRVLVANNNASAPDFAQFTTDLTYNTSGITSIQVSPAIPSDTPASTAASGNTCYIRIQLDTGVYRQLAFTSWTGDTFSIASTDFTDPLDATAGNNLFIGYIDKLATGTSEAVTMKYSSDRTMFVRVRDGGATPIKTFESTASFGSGGGSATAVRTSDA